MTPEEKAQEQGQKAKPVHWLRLALVYLFIPLVLFLCARDWHWWQGWVFALLVFLSGVGSHIWAECRHPGMMAERAGSRGTVNSKSWDRVLAPLMAFSIVFPLIIVAGLDHRFGWSPSLPLWLILVGFVLITGGYLFASWALSENRFFSGVVRIQKERGHTVCDRGPYRIVRHPGYLGNILPLPGIVLALGSLWAIIPAVAALVIVIIRTALEDRTLQAELPGYREYAQRVKYRLFPGLF